MSNAASWPLVEGCWCEALRPADRGAPRPALFLDRDGVVAVERHFLRRVEDVALIDGAAAAIAAANRAGLPVVLVSNQSGIARGLLGWAEFAAVQREILARLAAAGARLDLVLACPFHPDHPWRKPNPGMLLEAARRLPIDLARSLLVGDKADDLRAGRAAGLRQGAHVLTGHGRAERDAAAALAGPGFAVRLWDSLAGGLASIASLSDSPPQGGGG